MIRVLYMPMSGLRQWMFEQTLPVLCLACLGMLYVGGTVWYENICFICTAYGLL